MANVDGGRPAATGVSRSIESAFIDKALGILESLKGTTSGEVLYAHVEQLLNEHLAAQSDVTRGYASLVSVLLEAYAAQLTPGSPLHVEIKLIQMRLKPPLSALELASLRNFVGRFADQIAHADHTSAESLACALAPLVNAFNIDVAEVPASAPPASRRSTDTRPAEESSAATIEHNPEAERRVDSVYRRYLDEKREDLSKLQSALVGHIQSAISQTDEFGVLLDVERAALQNAESKEEIEELRQALLSEIDAMREGHGELSDKLGHAKQYLHLVESDAKHLNEELSRVRTLSLTDELTELPNRRAFLRHLEDELSRAQRYGSPLTVALIDLDNFKVINDSFGHAAGDAVLHAYATDVLSMFRKHDMVARYGGDEFAVILPNTDVQGARAALTKIERRADETKRRIEGVEMPMPELSAGIVLCMPGDTPDGIMRRVDTALYKAKHAGRGRVEVVTGDQDDTGSSAATMRLRDEPVA